MGRGKRSATRERRAVGISLADTPRLPRRLPPSATPRGMWERQEVVHAFDDGWTFERVTTEQDLRLEAAFTGPLRGAEGATVYSLRDRFDLPQATLVVGPERRAVDTSSRAHRRDGRALVIRSLQLASADGEAAGDTLSLETKLERWGKTRQFIAALCQDGQHAVYAPPRHFEEDEDDEGESINIENVRDFNRWFDGAANPEAFSSGVVDVYDLPHNEAAEMEMPLHARLGLSEGYEHPTPRFAATGRPRGFDSLLHGVLYMLVDSYDRSRYRLSLADEDIAAGLMLLEHDPHNLRCKPEISLFEEAEGIVDGWVDGDFLEDDQYFDLRVRELWREEGHDDEEMSTEDEERLREKVEEEHVDQTYGRCHRLLNVLYKLNEDDSAGSDD